MLLPSAFPSTSSSATSGSVPLGCSQAKAVYHSCPGAIPKPSAALRASNRIQAALFPRDPLKQSRASRHCRRLYPMAAKASESEDREGQKSKLRLLVKLGGAAITQKQTFQTLNEPVLKQTAAALARAIHEGTCDDGSLARTVIVHGAGSFGHFQAAEGNVVGGGLDRPAVRKGFVGCRLATKKLQIHVLEALVSEGIEAVGISPMGKWTTNNRQLHHVWREDLDALLQEGFVPVLHGDGVFDKSLGCTVLSGDVVMSHLASTERPEVCVFLTNVDGVFTKPPEEEGAVLLRHIKVRPDGTWKAEELEGSELSASNDGNDTTGGIVKKIEEAACIAREGVPVVIAKAGTEDATAALMLGAAAFSSEGEEMLGRSMRGTLVAPSLD